MKLQLRRDTDARWTAINPTLDPGEPGFATDTGVFKIGNGVDPWNDLDAAGGGGGGAGTFEVTVGPTVGDFATIDEALDLGFRALLIVEKGTYEWTKHRIWNVTYPENKKPTIISSLFDRSEVIIDTKGFEWLFTTGTDFIYPNLSQAEAVVFEKFGGRVTNILEIDMLSGDWEPGDFFCSHVGTGSAVSGVIREIISSDEIIIDRDGFYMPAYMAGNRAYAMKFMQVEFSNLTITTDGIDNQYLTAYDPNDNAYAFMSSWDYGPQYDVHAKIKFKNCVINWSNAEYLMSYDAIGQGVFCEDCLFLARDGGGSNYIYGGPSMYTNCEFDIRAAAGGPALFKNCSLIGVTNVNTGFVYDGCRFQEVNISGWLSGSVSEQKLLLNCWSTIGNTLYSKSDIT
jgi:hypothetical protein